MRKSILASCITYAGRKPWLLGLGKTPRPPLVLVGIARGVTLRRLFRDYDQQ